jgi:retron-type reverse transcriptase
MQDAATVLDVIGKRGARGLPVERLYRQMFNPQLYLMAYGKLYANKGAMTPGVSGETVDGMSLAKIGAIIGALRAERYRWQPVKRVYIPKKNGKKRPLGLPAWSDKLVAEVVRLLLEAYYEPQFSGRSHGFRPARGCHTALSEVVEVWKGTHWFIEGDICDCFGSLDHEIMIKILAEKIHDGRFLRLIGHMLKAGYLEDWRWHATLSGSPQGGIASPVLSNIYLDRLDQYVEQRLLPEYNLGRRRRPNRAYQVVEYAIARARRHKDRAEARSLILRRRQLPSQDPADPGLPAAQVCPLCRRLAAGVRRSQARGRGHQVEDRGVPARRTEAGTVAVQDADHARHQPGGALPRLRDQSPALRHQDHPAAPGGQRGDRAVRAEGRHPAAVRALHE